MGLHRASVPHQSDQAREKKKEKEREKPKGKGWSEVVSADDMILSKGSSKTYSKALPVLSF